MHIYRLATESDNEKILQLINSTPQQGLLKLNFERSPNYFFGSAISSQHYFVVIAENPNNMQIDGVASIGVRKAYVNGVIKSVTYVNDLRISEAWRGGRMLLMLYKKSREYMTKSELIQFVIMQENVKSISAVTYGRAGMPRCYPFGKLTTYIVSTAFDFAKASTLNIRKANNSDIDKIQRFFDAHAPRKQFFPAYEFDQIESNPYYRGITIHDYYIALSNNKIIGMCGVWKQKNFKQTKIISYPKWMSLTRPLYNLWCNVCGGLPLPKKGKAADYVMLHTILVKDDDSSILKNLLKHIRMDLSKNNEKTMILGLCFGDPLQQALRGFKFKNIHSLHYLASYETDPREQLDNQLPMYLEIARL